MCSLFYKKNDIYNFYLDIYNFYLLASKTFPRHCSFVHLHYSCLTAYKVGQLVKENDWQEWNNLFSFGIKLKIISVHL